jgi:hypothetical protein
MPGGLVPRTVQLARTRRWFRTHLIVLSGLALIAGQLGWTSVLLSRSYFRQGDFALLDGALRDRFGWSYLMRPGAGHLQPIGQALTWALAHGSLYNWAAVYVVVMIGVAAASLAMLRMLLTVFTRPDGTAPAGILVMFVVYLFCPLAAGTAAWWSEALWVLPLQVAMFMAVAAHVRYLRDGKRRHVVAVICWLAIGMLAADQGALVPVLLFALTAGYFEPGRLRDATRQALTGHWRVWVAYGAVLAGYCAVFFAQLVGTGVHVAGPGKATSLYEFAGTLLGVTVLPGLLGGPWRWQASGYAVAAPPAAAQYLAWVLVAIVVLASCVFRLRAWRAWVILLGWIVAADIVPAAIGGFPLYATALGRETGYLADATGVLALCLGLAFLPAGESVRPTPRAVRVLAISAFCFFIAGTVVSQQAFGAVVSGSAARSYIATARKALASAPAGTLIVNSPTPDAVLNPGFFPAEADTVQVIGPLARSGKRARRAVWTPALTGVPLRPMIFNGAGKLAPVVVAGVNSVPPPKQPPGKLPDQHAVLACWNVTGSGTVIPLEGALYSWSWTARLAYSGPAGVLWISLGDGGSQQVSLPAGQHIAYVPLTGAGNSVSVWFSGTGQQPLCLAGVTVGLVHADDRHVLGLSPDAI